MQDDFALKIKTHTEQLKNHNFREIEEAVTCKRLAWLKHNSQRYCFQDRITPRQVFQILFFDYMGLSAEDLPVVKETKDEIVWHSLNHCSTLEACLAVGLDTRQVCREIYERSTQAFIAWFDPQLHFMRSYTEIRPYTPYCKEWIVRIRDSVQ